MNYSQQLSDAAISQDLAAAKIRESVSALMDGEADELELRRLLGREHGPAVNDCWQRYHLLREVMRSGEFLESDQAIAFRHLDISAQVSAAIAAESAPRRHAHGAWIKPVAGMAVAASVAFAVVFGVRGLNQAAPGSAVPLESLPVVASNRAYPVAGATMQASAGSVQHLVASPAVQLPDAQLASQAQAEQEANKRLDMYLLRHTENAALNNGQGMISFARVASFETE